MIHSYKNKTDRFTEESAHVCEASSVIHMIKSLPSGWLQGPHQTRTRPHFYLIGWQRERRPSHWSVRERNTHFCISIHRKSKFSEGVPKYFWRYKSLLKSQSLECPSCMEGKQRGTSPAHPPTPQNEFGGFIQNTANIFGASQSYLPLGDNSTQCIYSQS